MQKGAARCHSDHGQGVWHVFRGQGGAFQRVKRDVNGGAAAGADLFADKQHRCLVAFALADDHDARDIQQVQLVAHGIDRRLIGSFFIAAPDQFGRGKGGCFGHTGKAE